MKLLIKGILVVVFVGGLSAAVLLGYTALRQVRSGLPEIGEQTISWEDNGIHWYQDENRSYVLATFTRSLWLSFQANNPLSMQEIAAQNSLALAINGGYFQRSINNTFSHSGLLVIDGKVQYALVQDRQKQVTHVVIDQGEQLRIISSAEAVNQVATITQPGVNALQTGPIILVNNVVQTSAIADSLNGDSRHIRSVIGFVKDGDALTKFVFISKIQLSLTETAELLMGLEPFVGKELTAVNLDGGSSTAIYAPSEEFSFGALKRLPAIIGLR